MEKIMNEENEWDHVVKTDVVHLQGPVEKVAHNEIVEAMQKMKSRKVTVPSEVSVVVVKRQSQLE